MIRDPRDPNIIALCRVWGPEIGLQEGEPDGAALLYALYLNERYARHNEVPRFERGYAPGGRYCNRRLWEQYGRASACSYSNWQLMFPVACELGYAGTPEQLDDDATAIEWVVRLLRTRLVRLSRKDDGGAALDELLDAYNSGNPHDANVPAHYIAQGAEHYADALDVLCAPSLEEVPDAEAAGVVPAPADPGFNF